MQYPNISNKGRIGLLTPYFASNRGNSTTAKRLIYGLEQNGYETEVFAYQEEKFDENVHRRLANCDYLHIIHYFRFAKWLSESGVRFRKPYIITSGGTDVNENLYNQNESSLMKEVLDTAGAITVFIQDARDKLIKKFPDLDHKIHVVPQSVWLPSVKQLDCMQLPNGSPKLLLPAGLRPVKDVLFLRDAFLILKDQYPNLQLLFAGPILDEPTYQEVIAFIKQNSWAHYIGEIPLEKMVQVYEWSDYVVNSSISEGQSSAILEAMYIAKIVLARHNAGNESIINDKFNGMLFVNANDFIKKLNVLEEDHHFRENLSQRAKDDVLTHFDLQSEIEEYIKLYKKIEK